MITMDASLCRARYYLLFAELMLIAVLVLAPTAVSALPDSFNEGGSGWDDETVGAAFQWGSRRGQEPGSRQPPASQSQLWLGSHRQALE